MKKYLSSIFLVSLSVLSFGQGLHFSQYNNAPILLNPANTGLLQENDWRAGINYRTQWGTLPVPYNTFSLFADGGLFRSKWESSWLGAGIAAWRDVAGDGQLALTKVQASLAYHVLTSERSSLSAGLGASYNQRSVDFSKLSYDSQWDEFSFNRNLSNNETNLTQKSTFVELSTGVNFAFYNNDNLYLKMSLGARNINQPNESFYGVTNKLGLRPMANVELTYKANPNLMINPSFYYTRQKKSSELVGGALLNINVGENRMMGNNEFLIGAFYRHKDAAILASGYKFRQHRFMVSYDHTISDLSQGNNGFGAFEVSLILQGNYKPGNEITNTYGCPRF